MKDSENDRKKGGVLPPLLELDLPSDLNFISISPKISAGEMARMCEAMLPYWNKRRFVDGFDTSTPIYEEFVL